MQIVTGIEVNSEAYFPKLREYCPSAEATRAIFPQLRTTMAFGQLQYDDGSAVVVDNLKLVNRSVRPTCTTFGQSIPRKIFIIVATRCHLLRLKCTKFDFGWGSAPDPAGGTYTAPQTP